jgi:protein SCO1/2
MVLDGVSAALATQPWTVGQEMTVLTVSIDPRDSPSDAAGRRRRVLQRYGREAASTGWHFLVAEQTVTDDENLAQYGRYDSAERLAEALGFRYQWMPRQGQYAHPGVMMILTPDGRVARYLYGLEYPTNDVRLGLLEASEGRSISTVEHVLLYCYRYDATEQAYVVMAWRIMKVGGALTAAFLLLALALLWRRELGRKQERGRPPRLLAAPPSSPPLLDDEDGQAGLNARS